MKKIKLFSFALSLLFIHILKAQNSISFSYDKGGNLIQRKLVVMPQRPGLPNPTPHSEKKDSVNVVEFKVYPNPAKDFLNIEGSLPDGIKNANVYLINNSGQVLKTDSYNGDTKQLMVSDLKPGIYYLEVNYSKQHSSNYKIIISN